MPYGKKNNRKQYTGSLGSSMPAFTEDDERDENALFGTSDAAQTGKDPVSPEQLPVFPADTGRQWGESYDPGGQYQDQQAPAYGPGGDMWSPDGGYGDDFAYDPGGFQPRPEEAGMETITAGVDSDALAAIANGMGGADPSGNQGLGDLDQEGSRETSSQAVYDRVLDLLSGQGMDTSDIEAGIMDQYRSDLGQGMGGIMAGLGGAGWGQSGLVGVAGADMQEKLSRQATQDIYNTRADARAQMMREYAQAAQMAGAAGDLELQQMLIDLIQNEMDPGDTVPGDEDLGPDLSTPEGVGEFARGIPGAYADFVHGLVGGSSTWNIGGKSVSADWVDEPPQNSTLVMSTYEADIFLGEDGNHYAVSKV